MKKTLFWILLLGPLLATSQSNSWDEIGFAMGPVHTLMSHDDKLFFGGNFIRFNNEDCRWSGYWDGEDVALGQQPLGGGGFRKFIIHNGELFGIGALSDGLVKWNYNGWDPEGATYQSSGALFSDGDTLFIGTDFGRIYAYVSGTGLLSTPLYDFGRDVKIHSITKFNGELIIAGKSEALNNVGVLRGGKWQTLGSGLPIRQAFGLIHYDGKLLLIGDIKKGDESPATGILIWDGVTWSDLGGSITSDSWNGVRDAVVLGKDLYVVGDFEEVGGVACTHAAKWNGSEWLPLDLPDYGGSFPQSIAVHKNELVIGYFDFDSAYVFRKTLYASSGQKDLQPLVVYPNPSQNQITLQMPTAVRSKSIRIFDATGQEVWSSYELTSNTRINLSHFQLGVYQLLVQTEQDDLYSKTLIKN